MNFKKLNKKEISVKIGKYQKEIEQLEKEDYSFLYNQDVAYHNYGYIHTFRVISDGLRLQNIKQFSAGLLAGIWISLTYIGGIAASYSFNIGDENHHLASLSKIIFSVVFSFVIVLISFLGGGFVTAHMWYNRTMFKGVERWSIFLKACGLVYAGNVIGMLLVVLIFQLTGTMQNNQEMWNYFESTFIVGKLYGVGSDLKNGGLQSLSGNVIGNTLLWTTMSAILCNFLVCLATQGSKSTKGNTVATMIIYMLILFYFAIGGYQHCVANWYIAWMIITESILQPSHINPHFTWIFLLLNIIPSIIGNFIGALIIGWIMSMFNKEFDALLLKEARLKFLKEEIVRLENKKNLLK